MGKSCLVQRQLGGIGVMSQIDAFIVTSGAKDVIVQYAKPTTEESLVSVCAKKWSADLDQK